MRSPGSPRLSLARVLVQAEDDLGRRMGGLHELRRLPHISREEVLGRELRHPLLGGVVVDPDDDDNPGFAPRNISRIKNVQKNKSLVTAE